MKKQLSNWGRQCKAQMALKGKSLADISNETKLSKTYISAIINGRVIVPEETAKAISDALEVDMALR